MIVGSGNALVQGDPLCTFLGLHVCRFRMPSCYGCSGANGGLDPAQKRIREDFDRISVLHTVQKAIYHGSVAPPHPFGFLGSF